MAPVVMSLVEDVQFEGKATENEINIYIFVYCSTPTLENIHVKASKSQKKVLCVCFLHIIKIYQLKRDTQTEDLLAAIKLFFNTSSSALFYHPLSMDLHQKALVVKNLMTYCNFNNSIH